MIARVPPVPNSETTRPTNRPIHRPETQPAERDLAVGQPAGDPLDLLEVGADDQAVLHGELVVGEEVDRLLGLLVALVDAQRHRVVEGQRRGRERGGSAAGSCLQCRKATGRFLAASSVTAMLAPRLRPRRPGRPGPRLHLRPGVGAVGAPGDAEGVRHDRRDAAAIRSRSPTTRASTTCSSRSAPPSASRWSAERRGRGVALVLFGTGSMLAAALVLITSDRTKARAAASRALFPGRRRCCCLAVWAAGLTRAVAQVIVMPPSTGSVWPVM